MNRNQVTFSAYDPYRGYKSKMAFKSFGISIGFNGGTFAPPYYQQVFHRGKTLFHLQAILKTVRLFPLNYFCGMQKEAFANAFVCDLLAKLDQVYEHALNATKLYVNHCYVQLVLTTHALLLLIFANLVG